MEAGKLRNRITIQTKTVTYNTYNEPIGAWADSSSVWAEMITTGGKELYIAQKVYTETEVVFRIRHTVITSLQRIKCGGRYYQILNINDVENRHKELLIFCKEAV